LRFITFADSHFSNSLQYNKVDPVTGISARFQEQLDLFKYIIDQAVKRDIKFILHAGDFYDRPNPTDLERTEVEKILEYAKGKERHLICIAGNHDITDNYTSNSDKFDHYFNFITKPIKIRADDFSVMCVPWGSNYEECFKQDADVLLVHAEFKNAYASNGHVFKNGIEVPDYPYIAAGHTHASQEIGSGCYPGSLIRMNFGERDNKNYFVVYDGEPENIELKSREMYEFNDETLDLDKIENNIIKMNTKNREEILELKNKIAERNPLWASVRCQTKKDIMVSEFRIGERSLCDNFRQYCEKYEYGVEVIKEGVRIINEN